MRFTANLKLIFYTVVFFMAITLSCSKDDKTPDSELPPEDNVTESFFIGSWNSEMGNFIFFNEGYAKLLTLNDNGNVQDISYGKWFYDESAEIFYTLQNLQLPVIRTSENSWTGRNETGEADYLFTRLDEISSLYARLQGADFTCEKENENSTGRFYADTQQIAAESDGNLLSTLFFSADDAFNLYLYQDAATNDVYFKCFSNYESDFYVLVNSGIVNISNPYSATDLTLQLIPSEYFSATGEKAMTLTVNNTVP